MQSIKFFVFASWVALMGIFMQGQGYLGSHRCADSPSLKPGDYNYIVFFRGKRAGDIKICMRANHLNAEGSLSFFSFGQQNTISFRGLAILSESMESESFIVSINANGEEYTIRGTEHGGGMKVDLASGSFETSFISPAGLRVSDITFPGLHPGGGDFRVTMQNPLTGRKEPVSVTSMGEKRVNGVRLNKFRIQNRNMETSVWTCPEGNTVMASLPPGFKFVEASFADRIFPRTASPGLPDFASELSISASIPVDAGREIQKAVFRFGGFEPGDYVISSHRQDFSSDRLTVRPQRGPSNTPAAFAESEEFLPYLEPAPLVETGHPAIAEAARGITGGVSCAWEAAKKINAWLFENIEKEYSPGIPSSLATLESMSGDCNEHSFLFAALARSSGIPAKICVGLAYYEGSFYYHAWPAVFVGEWVEMDPTLGLETVGATHVKLIEGGLAEQMKLAGLAGRIELELERLEYDKDRNSY